MDNNELDKLRELIEGRQWDKAWEEFRRLANQGPSSARLLLMGSHTAFGQRDLFRARHLADAALATWSPPDSPKLLGQIRFHLGMVTHDAGDTHVALEQFHLFLSELSSQYPELSMGESKAYLYLALTLRQRRDPDGAIAAYRKAVACCHRDGLPSLLCKALHNLAWLLCHMGRPAEARECLTESDFLAVTTDLRIYQKLGEAFLAATEGDHTQARQLCQDLFRMAERGEPVPQSVQALAAWVAGRVAFAEGDLTNALALADIALTYAAEARDARLINDATTLRREIYIKQRAGA